MEAKSLARHIATQHADYEVLPKTPGPYPVIMRNESNMHVSDIEEDIVRDYDVAGSKSSGSSL